MSSGDSSPDAIWSRRWLPAFRAAARGERLTQVLWIGDSLSELNATGLALPWEIGRILTDGVETTQYRNAGGDPYSPSMDTDGTPVPLEESGLGGRAVDLAAGQRSVMDAHGRALTVVWSRRPGGGRLEVRWCGQVLGTIDTSGPERRSLMTTYDLGDDVSGALEVVGSAGTCRFEGAYVHQGPVDSGVKVWAAVRSGNMSRHFVDHAGLVLDAVDELEPDLVVIATGTNDDDHPGEVVRLAEAVLGRPSSPEVGFWIPPANERFTTERVEATRAWAADAQAPVIDAAADLGPVPTMDGVHHSPLATALCAVHAASVLSGEGRRSALILADVMRSLAGGQTWTPGIGQISLDAIVGLPILSARARKGDSGLLWALVGPELAQTLELPGPSLCFGPGGEDQVDAHLSRAAPGALAVNGGRGQLDVARLRLGEGTEPEPSDGSAVIYLRGGASGPELAVKLSDGSSTVLAGGPVAGALVPPLPCALGAHRRLGPDVALERGSVVWVPLPVLGTSAVVTHLWVEIVAPAPVRATLALVATGADGLPAEVLSSTAADAVDLSEHGTRGAALAVPQAITVGERRWVAVHVSPGDGDPVARGAEDVDGWPTVQVGAAPVVPAAGRSGVGFRMAGQNRVPDSPGPSLENPTGGLPVVYASLEAP